MNVTTKPMLQVAINGARQDTEHVYIPRSLDELAEAAGASVAAGARVVHLHAYDSSGRQSLEAEPCAAALRSVRARCPGIPVSLSTSAEIEPDPRRRHELITRWSVLPELVTANQGEAGIVEVCEALIARGVGIEAGLLSLSDAEMFVGSGLAGRCARVLIEPLDSDPATAVAHARRMEELLARSGIRLEQVHHGDGVASWAVNESALERGHGIRTGLEDTIVLPDGNPAPDNAALVRVAAGMIQRMAVRRAP